MLYKDDLVNFFGFLAKPQSVRLIPLVYIGFVA